VFVSATEHPNDPSDPSDKAFPDFAKHVITHPHDAFTKYALSDPRRAETLFRSKLPETISSRVDWPTLKLQPSTFVDTDLRETRADLLFTARCHDHHELQFYLLLEGQSKPDPSMPLRLLAYHVAIYQEQFNQNKLPLVPVISFVLHQGPKPWNITVHFADLFALPEGIHESLAPFLPSFRYALFDLTDYKPESMEHDRALQTILQLMKMARLRDIEAFLTWLVKTFNEALSDHLIRAMLTYCLSLNKPVDLAKIQLILKGNPHLEQQAMSIAEQLRTEGLQEGLQKGRQEGLVAAMQKSVLDVLKLRFDRVPRGLRVHIQAITDPNQLDHLHKSAVRAASLEDFAKNL